MAEKVGRAGRVAEDDKRLGAGVEGSGSSSNLRTFQIIARFGNPLMGAIPLRSMAEPSERSLCLCAASASATWHLPLSGSASSMLHPFDSDPLYAVHTHFTTPRSHLLDTLAHVWIHIKPPLRRHRNPRTCFLEHLRICATQLSATVRLFSNPSVLGLYLSARTQCPRRVRSQQSPCPCE